MDDDEFEKHIESVKASSEKFRKERGEEMLERCRKVLWNADPYPDSPWKLHYVQYAVKNGKTIEQAENEWDLMLTTPREEKPEDRAILDFLNNLKDHLENGTLTIEKLNELKNMGK